VTLSTAFCFFAITLNSHTQIHREYYRYKEKEIDKQRYIYTKTETARQCGKLAYLLHKVALH